MCLCACAQYTLEREGVIEKHVEKRTLIEEGVDDTDHDKVCVDVFCVSHFYVNSYPGTCVGVGL